MTIDTALAAAEREGHVGDIYDLNSTTYTIWLIQHAYATRNGGWTAVSEQQQRQWSLETLYQWLEVQHARGVVRYLYDQSTRQLLHRYKIPFKANMRIPPAATERFKWVKGAKRLSNWMESGGIGPIDPSIQKQLPPALIPPPPMQSQREERRAAMWDRVADRGSRMRRIANDDSDDAKLTRDVVQSVMSASRRSGVGVSDEPRATSDDDSDSEESLVRELERVMEQSESVESTRRDSDDELPFVASDDNDSDSDESWVRELARNMGVGVRV